MLTAAAATTTSNTTTLASVSLVYLYENLSKLGQVPEGILNKK